MLSYYFFKGKTMRKLSALLAVMTLTATAHAVLPTPTDEVSFVAKPTGNPNAPTTYNTPVQPVVTPVAVAPLQTTLPNPPLNTLQNQTAQGNITSVVNAFVVQNINGQEMLTPVNANTPVKSGDILEYQGLFTNHGERVRSMDVTLTIDDKLELVGGLSPSFAHASVDHSRFVRMPIRANIGGQVQELPLSYYKALRWTVEDIGMGGTAVVKYRAIVK